MESSFNLVQLLIQPLIIGFAALVHGTVGIGFPLIATPLLAMIMDVQSAVVLLVLPTITLNTMNILKGGKWDQSIARYWPLAIYGMVGSVLGTLVLVRISPDMFRPLLAAVLIFYLNAERLGVRLAWISKKPGTAMVIFGLVAGFLGGTVNVMLPALIVFALEVQMDKTAMIQVFNFCFLLGKLTQGAVLVLSGHMTAATLSHSIPLALVALVIMALGMRLRDRIQANTYRKWLRSLLLAMAAVLLFQSVSAAVRYMFPA